MHPILFEIPGIGFPIRAFGVMVVFGFILGTMFFTRLSTRHAIDAEQEAAGYSALPVWILIGVLVIPVGKPNDQTIVRVIRRGTRTVETSMLACRFVKLIGQEGWAPGPDEA